MEVLIEKTRPKTVEFISKLSKEPGMADDRETARRVLTSALHVWRDNVPLDYAIEILTSLPPYLKEIFIINWKPSTNPVYYNETLCFIEEFINYYERSYNHKLSFEKASQYVRIVFSALVSCFIEPHRKAVNPSLSDNVKFIIYPGTLRAA